MNIAQLDKIDQLLTSLINNPEYGNVTLTLNDYVRASRGNDPMRDYSVKEVVEDEYWSENFEWLSPEDTALAVEHNTFYTMYWYPDTPVGSYRLDAYSLSAMIEMALQVKHVIDGRNLALPEHSFIHDFDQFLRSKLYSPTASLTLQYNDHKSCYTPTADRVKSVDRKTWINPDEPARVLATDRLWELYRLELDPLRSSSLSTLLLHEVS